MSAIIVPRYGEIPGVPENGHAIVLTNSGRQGMACHRKWWFEHAEGLRSKFESEPLRYGNGWHAFMDDLYSWFAAYDTEYPAHWTELCVWCAGTGVKPGADASAEDCGCLKCRATGLPIHRLQGVKWREDAKEAARLGEPFKSKEEIEQAEECLKRAIEGLFVKFGRNPPAKYRILGTERSFARPITYIAEGDKHGRPVKPSVWVLTEANGDRRMARTGEAKSPPDGCTVQRVAWPWLQAMTLDAFGVMRDNPEQVVIFEWKSSQNPKGYLEGLSVDRQVIGYWWGMSWAIAQGLIPEISKTARIVRWVYAVASSTFQKDPEITQKGVPSRAKANTPSWRYADTIRRLGLDPTPFQDHISELTATVDLKLYVSEGGSHDAEDLLLYEAEIGGIAMLTAANWRKAAVLETDIDLEMSFPRIQTCKITGCVFRGPCIRDGEDVRRNYKVTPPISWRSIKEEEEP